MNNRVLLSDEYIDELIYNLTSELGMCLAEDSSISEAAFLKGTIIGGKSFLGIIDICCDENGYIIRYDFKITTLELDKDNQYKFDEYEILLKYAKLFYDQYKKYVIKQNA